MIKTDSLNKIKEATDKIHGWLPFSEGKALYECAQKCTGRGVIVEIGSWKGKSTIWLAFGSKAGSNIKIYAIDPHINSFESQNLGQTNNTFDEFVHNIQSVGMNDIIVPIVKPSLDAIKDIDKPIEFLFIDGAHDYKSVLNDFIKWSPKLINGGSIAFHDTMGHKGPRAVVNKYIFRSDHYKNIKMIDELTIAQKSEHITWIDKIRNYSMLLIKKMCECFIDMGIPKPIREFGKKIVRKLN